MVELFFSFFIGVIIISRKKHKDKHSKTPVQRTVRAQHHGTSLAELSLESPSSFVAEQYVGHSPVVGRFSHNNRWLVASFLSI